MEIKELILDDFEHGDINKYEISHSYVSTYGISLSNELAMYGNSSLKLSYNFGGWLTGNGAMPIKFKENLTTHMMPKKLSVWVYGDGKSPWLRASFIDGTGSRKTVNFTSGNIDWIGWKYLDVPLDPSWTLPITLEQIYAAEVDKTHQGNPHYRGQIYFDALRFVFVDDEDLSGPIFTDTYPQEDSVYKDSFTFYTTVTDEMSGVDPNSIIVKVNNERVKHQFYSQNNRISYTFQHIEAGNYHISIAAKDNAGNNSVPGIDKNITVGLSPDIEEPIVSDISPTETAIVHTNTPRITCKLIDLKSGIDTKDILIELDGRVLDVTYDELTGWCYAVSQIKLKDGDHEFSITAKDRSGNTLGPISKTFTICGIKEPVNKHDFQVSIIPDTHSSKRRKDKFKRVAEEDTHFVIHMGDMIDQATEEEYIQLKQDLELLGNKLMLTMPGNHESFQGNLDSYMKLFGSPTYHLEYGNALIVVLNTAYEQSIHASDSTQFAYLEELLNNNEQKNIIIATHVTTKDIFGTAHEMAKEDAERLEQILGNYKKENEHINIIVLFGHLHVLKQWEVDGVNYAITGNGADKGYVKNNQGNIFGHGILKVSGEGMNYRFIPHLTEISIVNDKGEKEKVKIGKGQSHILHIIGDFFEVTPSYTLDLTEYDLIDTKWSSSNETIAKVDSQGVIQGMGTGEASIEVETGGKKAFIKVVVM